MTEPTSGARLNRRSLFGAAAATIGTAAVLGAAGSTLTPPHARAADPAAARRISTRRSASRVRRPRPASVGGGRTAWWTRLEIAREVDQVADAGFGSPRGGRRDPQPAGARHRDRRRKARLGQPGLGRWSEGRARAGRKAGRPRRHHRRALLAGSGADHHARRTRLRAASSRTDARTLPPARPSTRRSLRPTGEAHGADVELVTVQAHRVTAATSSITTLDPESYVDLSASVAGNRLAWTAPAEPCRIDLGGPGDLAPRVRPGARGRSAHQPALLRRRPLQRGRHAGCRRPVAGPRARRRDARPAARRRRLPLRGLPRDRDRGDDLDAALLEEFEARAGYDLRPWLPVVLEVNEAYRFALGTPGAPATTDALRTNQVRDDFNQVLSDLYRDYHLRPMQEFAATWGWACGSRPTAWRPTAPSTRRSWTSRRPSRSASRTWTTTG